MTAATNAITRATTSTATNTAYGVAPLLANKTSLLTSTFLHLPRIGRTTERKLWNQHVYTWNDFLKAKTIPGIGPTTLAQGKLLLHFANKALNEENTSFFYRAIPLAEHWRAYTHPLFSQGARYIDIETCARGKITVFGISDGNNTVQLIRGANLSKHTIQHLLTGATCLVTFNGNSFDLPLLERYFGRVLPPVPRIDLRHVCRRIGLTGGLKAIEQELNIPRDEDVMFTRGEDAVTLWHTFLATNNQHYLELLLRYNAHDCYNLKLLADRVIPDLQRKTIHAGSQGNACTDERNARQQPSTSTNQARPPC